MHDPSETPPETPPETPQDPINLAYADALRHAARQKASAPHTRAVAATEKYPELKGYRLRGHNFYVSDATWAAWPAWFRAHLQHWTQTQIALPYPTFLSTEHDQPKWLKILGPLSAQWQRAARSLRLMKAKKPTFNPVSDAGIEHREYAFNHSAFFSLIYVANQHETANPYLTVLHEIGHALRPSYWEDQQFYEGARNPCPVEELSGQFVEMLMSEGLESRAPKIYSEQWLYLWNSLNGKKTGKDGRQSYFAAPFFLGMASLYEFEGVYAIADELADGPLRDLHGKTPVQCLNASIKALRQNIGGAARSSGNPPRSRKEALTRQMLLGYSAAQLSRLKNLPQALRNDPALLSEIKAVRWQAPRAELIAFGQKNPFLWPVLPPAHRPDLGPKPSGSSASSPCADKAKRAPRPTF